MSPKLVALLTGGEMTKTREPIVAFEPDLQRKWRKDAGQPERFPRGGYQEVINLVNAAWPPDVFMREHQKKTDIVIRFVGSSRQLSPAHRNTYFKNSMPLTEVFEDAISNLPPSISPHKAMMKGKNTLRMNLATEAYRAYKTTWLRLFRIQFLNQIYPAQSPPQWFLDMEKVFKAPRPVGRPKQVSVSDRRVRRRFDLFLFHAKWLRQAISDYLVLKPAEARGERTDIANAFWGVILKIPGGISILGGEAFDAIPYEKRNKHASLEDPRTWKSRQLAMVLLAIETGQAYHTIERKLADYEGKSLLTPSRK
jgi:hypothetical protein